MANAIIIHGVNGHPKENWFPWIKSELEKIGCKCYIPQFPTPKNQNLERWNEVLKDYKKYLDEDSILIGHSLGAPYALCIIESLDKPIKAAFLVGGFVGKIGIKNIDIINKTITSRSFDFEKIKKNCKRFFLYNSDNDPYIRLEKGKELADILGVKLILVKGAGHFNIDSGYDKFGLLLKDVKKEL